MFARDVKRSQGTLGVLVQVDRAQLDPSPAEQGHQYEVVVIDVLVQADGAQHGTSPAEQGHQLEGEILEVLVKEMHLIIVFK